MFDFFKKMKDSEFEKEADKQQGKPKNDKVFTVILIVFGCRDRKRGSHNLDFVCRRRNVRWNVKLKKNFQYMKNYAIMTQEVQLSVYNCLSE